MSPSILSENGWVREPIKPSGALDAFSYDDTTPVIGREYLNMNIVDNILNGPDRVERLRQLAYTISARGVVFFRPQDNLTNELQKEFIHGLGESVGKPKESSLHIYPLLNDTSDLGVGDPQISHISSVQREKFMKHLVDDTDKYSYRSAEWHSDVQFERFPPDYTSLRASGYEIYDRFSPAYQKFFETLTSRFDGEGYRKAAENEDLQIREDNRGHPLDMALSSEHPVVRSNPVTGWKSIFAIGPFPSRIKQLTSTESQELSAKFMRMITENHDLIVRFKWKNPNDIAIWDNRCTFHTPTYDYEGLGERYGNRAVGIGEQPYFDPSSKSRGKDLHNCA